jgi:hypothetical protein
MGVNGVPLSLLSGALLKEVKHPREGPGTA